MENKIYVNTNKLRETFIGEDTKCAELIKELQQAIDVIENFNSSETSTLYENLSEHLDLLTSTKSAIEKTQENVQEIIEKFEECDENVNNIIEEFDNNLNLENEQASSLTGTVVGIDSTAIGITNSINNIIENGKNSIKKYKTNESETAEQLKISELINEFSKEINTKKVKYKGKDISLYDFIKEICKKTGLDIENASVADIIRACISTGNGIEAKIIADLLQKSTEKVIDINSKSFLSKDNSKTTTEYVIHIENYEKEVFSTCLLEKLYSVVKYYSPEDIKELDKILKVIVENNKEISEEKIIEEFKSKNVDEIIDYLSKNGYHEEAISLLNILRQEDIYKKIEKLPYDSIGIYRTQNGKEYVLYNQLIKGYEQLHAAWGIDGICVPSSISTIISKDGINIRTQSETINEMKKIELDMINNKPDIVNKTGDTFMAGYDGNTFLYLCRYGYQIEGYNIKNIGEDFMVTCIDKIEQHLDGGSPVWVNASGYFEVTNENNEIKSRTVNPHAMVLIDIQNNNGRYEGYVSDSSGAEGWTDLEVFIRNNVNSFMLIGENGLNESSTMYFDPLLEAETGNIFIENGYMVRPKMQVLGTTFDNMDFSQVYVDLNNNELENKKFDN